MSQPSLNDLETGMTRLLRILLGNTGSDPHLERAVSQVGNPVLRDHFLVTSQTIDLDTFDEDEEIVVEFSQEINDHFVRQNYEALLPEELEDENSYIFFEKSFSLIHLHSTDSEIRFDVRYTPVVMMINGVRSAIDYINVSTLDTSMGLAGNTDIVENWIDAQIDAAQRRMAPPRAKTSLKLVIDNSVAA